MLVWTRCLDGGCGRSCWRRECIEQLGRFLREGIGKLTALSERVADGDIVVLC
ncbi:DUF7364 domain-containing protein [Pseudomonas aeruginosa]|uniref:DUF7364 domain-containing protein n=1 Tax=Pseudomonas aeruginosa TaxID=287 RepID=UPI003CCBAD8F